MYVYIYFVHQIIRKNYVFTKKIYNEHLALLHGENRRISRNQIVKYK